MGPGKLSVPWAGARGRIGLNVNTFRYSLGIHLICFFTTVFDKPKRRHRFSNNLWPVECEKRYFQRLSSV